MHFSVPVSSVMSTTADERNIKDKFNFSKLRGYAGAMLLD